MVRLLKRLVSLKCASCCALLLCVVQSSVQADDAQESARGRLQAPQNAFEVNGLFEKSALQKSFFDGSVVDVSDEPAKPAAVAAPNTPTENKPAQEPTAKKPDATESGDVALDQVGKIVSSTAPTERSQVNPLVPDPMYQMSNAVDRGDAQGLKDGAKGFVDYMSNLMFKVRSITQAIGDELIKQDKIKEEDWAGVPQWIDYELTSTDNAALKVTHQDAMKRITADPKAEVEVYYFFTLNCSWCRKMAPDVERLWRVAKSDPRIKMVALTLGPQEKFWMDEYRSYTGLTVPIQEGAAVAKAFNIRFVPALVVVTPNKNTAYFKTGQQSFERMYDFVRRAQGVSSEINPLVLQLANTPIGEVETVQQRNRTFKPQSLASLPTMPKTLVVNAAANERQQTISGQRF